jgi:hypothetical protein
MMIGTEANGKVEWVLRKRQSVLGKLTQLLDDCSARQGDVEPTGDGMRT